MVASISIYAANDELSGPQQVSGGLSVSANQDLTAFRCELLAEFTKAYPDTIITITPNTSPRSSRWIVCDHREASSEEERDVTEFQAQNTGTVLVHWLREKFGTSCA